MQVSDDARVGTELAGYRVESLLGWGGMSVVYLAEDLRLKRKVALKLLAAGLAGDESFRERFLHESELAASIDHPNIVPIYEAGTSEDILFIAMRYVEGRDLSGRLQRGPLGPAEAIGILTQVASALDAAHARGLVHRDVKPSNVLLDAGARPDGSDHVYLADFGLTKRVSGETGVGDDGHLLGTIDYVAPEQIAGEEIDGRADVYSLGCVLYECLVGQPPFRRDSEIAAVFAHLEAEPPVPSAQRPELPTELDAVIAGALAKEPEQRYASCRELARAALAVAVDEASRLVGDVASRAATGREDLSDVEAELAGKVMDLQLVRAQSRALAGRDTPAGPTVAGICPFKGLAPFDPVDADYFFGRERLVAVLVARLAGAGFLGIVGPSGSGKSSVLRAGLLPALAGGVLPGSGGWRRWLLRPGERPLETLRSVLASDAHDPVAEALDALPAGTRLLLAVDQLEELFTACRSEAERAAFADTLARAAADPDGRAVVVAAMRADFYGRFAAYPGLAGLLGANHVLVAPMQASELRRAVELPAGSVGLRVDPILVDALVDDVEGEPGALPLLSTTLLELWQKRQDETLTLAAYSEYGGVHGAVARLAEGAYARIRDGRKPLVRAVMLRLVGEGEGDVPVRRRAPLAELDLERNEDVADVLATLADSRLVTVDEGTVEVAHEALLREWPRLREWIQEDAEGRRLRAHITRAATEWEAAGRDREELYRGARLAAALDWSADHAPELNELEREFVSESGEASEQETKRTRRTNRRLRGLLAGVAVLLAAAVAGGILAVVQRGEAREAETVQFAQRLGAQALAEDDLDLSLLLARQAVAIDDSPQTRGYLLADLLRAPAVIGIARGQTDVLTGIALSPDGRTLAVADASVGLLLFDARTFQRIGEPVEAPTDPYDPASPQIDVEAVAYSPDGETVAFGGESGYLRLIDARTHETLAEARNITSGVTGLAFTSDGSRLVVLQSQTDDDYWITIRDSSTLELLGDSIKEEGFIGMEPTSGEMGSSFAVTADSLVTASERGELAWWDLDSREKTRTIEIADGYHALAFSPDGRKAAIGLDDGIQLIDVRTGAVREAKGALTSNPISLRFSPNGKTVASTSRDGAVTLWDADAVAPRETLHGPSRLVQSPVFSPDGRTLYTTSNNDTVIAWDLTGKRRLGRSFTFTQDRGLQNRHPGAFSPEGRLIAVGLNGGGIGLWDANDLTRSGAPMQETGKGAVSALAFSPDGRTLAAVTSSFNPCCAGDVTLWDMESRSLRWGPHPLGGTGHGVSFSAGGTMLATAGWGGVRLWDVASGAELGRVGVEYARAVAFSPTEPLVAFVHDGGFSGGDRAEIWDDALRSRITTLHLDAVDREDVDAWGTGFSPDGRLLATSVGDRVHLWDVRTGELVREIKANVGFAVSTLEFSPDGAILGMSGEEPFASLWDVDSGAPIGSRLTAGGGEAMLDLSPDGNGLLMTLANGQGVVWDIDPASWAQRACALANRTLTREEWERFLPGRPYEPACAG